MDRISLVIGLLIGAVVVATVALIAATVKPDYAVAGIMGGLATIVLTSVIIARRGHGSDR